MLVKFDDVDSAFVGAVATAFWSGQGMPWEVENFSGREDSAEAVNGCREEGVANCGQEITAGDPVPRVGTFCGTF